MRSNSVLLTTLCIFAVMFGVFTMASDDKTVPRIGATTIVTEVSTGLPLEARVDTGAASCSVHCEQVVIPDESPQPDENVGKPIYCLLKNNLGETSWLKAEVIGYSGVRTTTKLDDRYFVNLTIRVNDVEDTVRVSLNDRTDMTYPFLLGRNFLRSRFIVDVRRDRAIESQAGRGATNGFRRHSGRLGDSG